MLAPYVYQVAEWEQVEQAAVASAFAEEGSARRGLQLSLMIMAFEPAKIHNQNKQHMAQPHHHRTMPVVW